ncbi:aprataxin isoform X2 [Lampris incognitus]|uniref:aprataxin isoform X2 n=1 Tax=Lampris incognitus TaxID=2546036 RepID=UPI0024B620C2|nr:aprataxin isoform X2 [Lampris incognitus]
MLQTASGIESRVQQKLGGNPTSVDSIVVGKGNEVKMKPGQHLLIVNQLYPYTVQFKEDPNRGHVGTKRRQPASEERENDKKASSIKVARPAERVASSVNNAESTLTIETTGHWSLGLKASMQDPKMQIYKDERVVVIKDKYPKARYHWLVLPWESIPSLKALHGEHCDLLRHMQQVADKMIQQCKDASSLRFRSGYHAIPSMSPLTLFSSHVHLHVISQDFDSPCLKNKKHWNSFTTDYFIESQDVIQMLEKNGRVTVKEGAGELLKQPLSCHVCHKELPTLPRLKDHLKSHFP